MLSVNHSLRLLSLSSVPVCICGVVFAPDVAFNTQADVKGVHTDMFFKDGGLICVLQVQLVPTFNYTKSEINTSANSTRFCDSGMMNC